MTKVEAEMGAWYVSVFEPPVNVMLGAVVWSV